MFGNAAVVKKGSESPTPTKKKIKKELDAVIFFHCKILNTKEFWQP